jgi:hypothetical protein
LQIAGRQIVGQQGEEPGHAAFGGDPFQYLRFHRFENSVAETPCVAAKLQFVAGLY